MSVAEGASIVGETDAAIKRVQQTEGGESCPGKQGGNRATIAGGTTKPGAPAAEGGRRMSRAPSSARPATYGQMKRWAKQLKVGSRTSGMHALHALRYVHIQKDW